jgi:hypothetical protein
LKDAAGDMGKIIRGPFVFCLLEAALAFFISCGIDDYVHLSPVAESEITIRNNTQAAIKLPFHAEEAAYFTSFVIFYRIYISGSLQAGEITPELMRTINASMYNDYNGIFPSTSNNSSNTTTVNTAVGSLFSGRRYYELALAGIDVDSVLGGGSQGETLVIEFPNNTRPFLVVGGGRPYELWRSNGEGAFDPQPDRYFVNHPNLTSSANLSTTINADAAGPSPSAGQAYAYASMYIAKTGRDIQTLGAIYSAPTFIGVFKLPENL